MKKFLIGAAMAGVATVALAQTPPAPPHRMMTTETQTRDQAVANVREHFTKLDANKDGAIAKEEIQAMRGMHMQRMAHGPGGPGGPHVMMREGAMGDPNAAFDRLDANKDGAISRDEFAKAREQRIEKRIVMKEGAGHGRHMGMRHGGGRGMRMLVMADSNGDGRVTLPEAEAATLKHFDMMDANRDGRLTPEERREMRMKIRTERKQKAG